MMRGWRSLLVLGLLMHGLDAAAQRVTNVTAEQQGQALVIGYALDADGPVEVQLFLSTDRGRTWDGPLKNCTGDLGKGVKPGTGKRIRWEVLQDRELVSDGVQFKVVAKGAAAIKPWMNPRLSYGSVTDIDGNTYATIRIGKQVWMAENLCTTRYRDGSSIPHVEGNSEWNRLTTDAWCNYENNAAYGKLYNWYAVADRRGLCPNGWHVPTDAEWTRLTEYLGGKSVAGGKMMGVTSASGFSGRRSGARYANGGSFSTLGNTGSWWSASESGSSYAWSRDLSLIDAGINRYDTFSKRTGLCVRCLQD